MVWLLEAAERLAGRVRTEIAEAAASSPRFGFMMRGVLAVLIFALSKAESVTIVNLIIWAVVFPALVTGLIAFAAIRAIGERQDNVEHDKRRRRRT